MPKPLMVLCLLLAACSRGRGPAGSPADEALQLCVENATSGYGNITAIANSVRYTVSPGETICRPLGVASSRVRLRATSTGGGIAGPLSFVDELDPLHYRCWRWTLTNARVSARLQPCAADPG